MSVLGRLCCCLFAAAALSAVVAPVSVSVAEEAEQLRGDVPAAAEVRREIADLQRRIAWLKQHRGRVGAELDEALEARGRLGGELSQLAVEVGELRRSAKSLVLSSFVSGGRSAEIRYLLDVDGASGLSRRRHLLDRIAEPLDETSKRLTDLESRADADLLALVDRIEELRLEIKSVEQRLDEATLAESAARARLVIADAWDRADSAIAAGPHGFVPRKKWERMRFCESTHNYRAVSPSGRYRGAYQFNLATWKEVGGTGDPAQASRREQDARARELYARRGHEPWPVCGRHLR